MGIHSTFTQDIANAICAELAEGNSLRKAAESVGVGASTVLGWAEAHKEVGEQYARARQFGYQLLADEILAISDDGLNDTYTDDDGNVRTATDVVARSRLRVDSRKWMLSKMLPKVYGDKLTHQGDAENPIAISRIERVIVRPKA